MAVRSRSCLKVPDTSTLGVLRTVSPLAGQDHRHGVWQRAALAQERRMDRRCSVRVEASKVPRLALQVGGLESVQQLLVVQVPQPRAVVCHPVGLPRDEEVPLLVAVRLLVHRRQPEQV